MEDHLYTYLLQSYCEAFALMEKTKKKEIKISITYNHKLFYLIQGLKFDIDYFYKDRKKDIFIKNHGS